MKKQNIITFIVAFLIGFIVVYGLLNSPPFQQPNTDNPSDSNIINDDEIELDKNEEKQEDNNLKIIEGEFVGFADSTTVEIVTNEGPISCSVYDEELISKLKDLMEQKIKVEIRYNENSKINIIEKIL